MNILAVRRGCEMLWILPGGFTTFSSFGLQTFKHKSDDFALDPGFDRRLALFHHWVFPHLPHTSIESYNVTSSSSVVSNTGLSKLLH